MAQKKKVKEVEKLSVEDREELKRKKCEIIGICLIALGIFAIFCVFFFKTCF